MSRARAMRRKWKGRPTRGLTALPPDLEPVLNETAPPYDLALKAARAVARAKRERGLEP
jgi:hypothetical protein